MKELLLFRHAKAEKRSANLSDRDRSLAEQGVLDAREIGEQLAEEELLPDLVLCSDAARAVQTYRSASGSWPGSRSLQTSPSLYDAGGTDLFRLVASSAGMSNRVMIVGHNPSLERFVELATGSDVHLKTGMVAILKVDIEDWSSFSPDSGSRLKSIISPSKDS